MPFLRNNNNKILKSTAHSLQAYLDNVQVGHANLFFLFYQKWAGSGPLKRVSRFIFHKKVKASMTLEAAMVLPLFLFFILNMIYCMNIIGTQSRIQAALHQTGNQMAFAGYAYVQAGEMILPDSLAGVFLSEGYARQQIIRCVGREYLEKSCVTGGAGGISLLGSSVMGVGDYIDLQVSYRGQPFTALMGYDGFLMKQRYYAKAWTGYEIGTSADGQAVEDPLVYLTETGTVYHVYRSCSYLNPVIKEIAVAEIAGQQNLSGGKYSACERCGNGNAMGRVYVTEQGSHYHRNLNCSGLKRTIYTVPLSQTGGRGRCSKCG